MIIFPILEKLKLKKDKDSQNYAKLIQHHLEVMISSYGIKMKENECNLTPREIEVCNLIKGNLSCKDISDILFISNQTVEGHRKNIRRKLKISNKSINLVSFLRKI